MVILSLSNHIVLGILFGYLNSKGVSCLSLSNLQAANIRTFLKMMNAVSDFCNVPFFFFLVRKENVKYDISVGF